MTMKWRPSGPFCPNCGGPNPKGVECGSCNYKPGDPLLNENGLFTKEELKIRVGILNSLGHPIGGKLKKFL